MFGKILETKHLLEDYYTVKIKVDDDYKFEPGQYTKFSLPSKDVEKGSNFRIFSFCNPEPDGTVLIGTRSRGEDISDFKKLLLSLEPGSEIEIAKPMGSFTVRDEKSPMIIFACGIGITPVMSILGSIKNETTREVIMIYSSRGQHIFEEELNEIAENNPKINITLTTDFFGSIDVLLKYAEDYRNEAYYYVCGSPDLVKDMEEKYKAAGIEKGRILADKFAGC